MDDLFDDVLSDAPVTRARPGGKFAPKVKSKRGISSKGRSNVNVGVSSSTEDPMRSDNYHDINLNNENALNNVAAPSTTRLTIGRMEELPKNGEGSFLDTNESLQVIDNSLEVSLNVGFKSDNVPISEIPMHEEALTNSADSPTLANFLLQDDPEEKKNANEREKPLKKHRRSPIAGVEDKGSKTSRQPRKQAVRELSKNPFNKAVEDDEVLDPPYEFDGDELEENDDEDEVDYSFKKKRASTSSKKKSVAKNGKTYKKRKKANDDLEKGTEEPPKKFPHSSRRRKRCVDKALLEDDYLDHRTLPLRDIIRRAERMERSAKKEATNSKTSSTNQSDRGFLDEDANNEEEFYGSDDGFRANENITSTTPLYNNQSFKDKTPRAKWSKQDTELFYEAVSCCNDFSMIQLSFPGKTRHQIKLKYKKEERQHPLQWLYDALNNHATVPFYKSVIEKQKQTSNKAEQDTARDASDFMPGEVVEDPTHGTNEKVATAEQDHIEVEDQEDPMENQIPEQSDDSDDELQRWSQYRSAI